MSLQIPNSEFQIPNSSAAADKIDHLDLIAIRDEGGVERPPPQDDEIVFDRNAAAVDVQLPQQVSDGHRTRQLEPIAVERDVHQCC
jgi:hypothetical protein